MSLKLNKSQKSVLSALLDVYEGSKTYRGENARNQSFSIKPERVFPEYDDDYTDQDRVDLFNSDMLSLEQNRLVELNIRRSSNVIKSIILNKEALPQIYSLLDRRDITELRQREIKMYQGYLGINHILEGFCNEQIHRLSNYKNAEYNRDVAENILELLKTILTNTRDIMERELSVAVLSDTKLFESSYRSRVCRIIERFGELEQDISEMERKDKEKIILEEFHVLSNPSYIFFKGNVEIAYNDGSVVAVKPYNPIAVSSEVIDCISHVRLNCHKVVTVENLAAYNRINDEDAVFIFLSGYHNRAKQSFLKKLWKYNNSVKWHHFGDIDPDGYYILKNLIAGTGINFEPVYMGVKELMKYEKYCKILQANDVKKATSLRDAGFYVDVMDFMLEHNCKLEQEIISWLKSI